MTLTATPRLTVEYRLLAESQGVVRPFDILVRMPPATRLGIARLLGCNLGHCIHPPAQAWCIINQNLRGLQARTHTIVEQLTPFSRNNNWWEIVTRTAQRLGLRYYPGVEEIEVERLVFERFAERFVRSRIGETAAVDSVADAHPVVRQVMGALRLSRDASRSVLSALALSTARADQSLREACRLASHWLRRSLRWSWVLTIPTGLALLHRKLGDVFSCWTAEPAAPDEIERVCAAVAVIHFQDVMDRAMEEMGGA